MQSFFFDKVAGLTAQKMKSSIKDFSSKCDQICRKLRIWSYLLKKSLMENFIFCAVPETCWNGYGAQSKFGSVKRKIAFIIDNCTYHSEVENLEWTELIFPSPKHQVTYSTDRPRCNSCCKTQTSFTSRLQTNFSFGLKRTNANHIHSVSVMMMLAKAWNAFSNKTFTNCFK